MRQANPTLSITPYTLEHGGFTPLSELNKPKVGDWGWFWNNYEDEDKECVVFGKLIGIHEKSKYPYAVDVDYFMFFFHTPPEFIKNKIIESVK